MNKNSEIRQNIITKEWVIYAPDREKRLHEYTNPNTQSPVPRYDANCPFCPGNEHMLAEIIAEHTSKQTGMWQTRIVPNKYPALTAEAGTERCVHGSYLSMAGYGRHEVIIEDPRHDGDIANMSKDEVSVLIETYHQRYNDIMKIHMNMMALIFRNHGAQAGTSLKHPHSQLLVTGVVPQHIRSRENEAQRYYDDWGRCVFCDMLKSEIRQQTRIVFENNIFLCFVPFAAEVPYETWIMPKVHTANFGDSSDTEKENLSEALLYILKKLYHKLNNPDYNYIINTPTQYQAEEPQLHWYLQIRPRLTKRAGFEIGSGMMININIPEEDAQFLRSD